MNQMNMTAEECEEWRKTHPFTPEEVEALKKSDAPMSGKERFLITSLIVFLVALLVFMAHLSLKA